LERRVKKTVYLVIFSILFLGVPSFSQKNMLSYSQVSAAGAVQANPSAVDWIYPMHVPGDNFTVSVDVVNVTDLFSFKVGFYFNQTYLKVIRVVEGGFLSNNSADSLLSLPRTIDNVNGTVTPYGWSLIDTAKAKTGSGHLINATFQLLSFSPPYTGTFPGTPVDDMRLSVDSSSQIATILIYKDDITVINPDPANVHSGTFSLTPYHGPPSVPPTRETGNTGIVGYTIVFNVNGTIYNTLNTSITIDYYWSFDIDKWDGTQ
jgi:hypothetical protein